MKRIHKKDKTKKRLLIILISLILVIVILVILNVMLAITNAKRKQIWQDAESFCESLFESGVVKEDVTEEDMKTCLEKLDIVDRQDKTDSYREAIKDAKFYFELKNEIANYYDEEGIFKEETREAELTETEHAFGALAEPYREKLEAEMNRLWAEFEKVRDVKEAVLGLFDGLEDIEYFEQAEVSEAVEREQYEDVRQLVDIVSQVELKEKLQLALKKVDEKISRDEQILREKQEAERRAYLARLEAERIERERIEKERREAEERRQAEIAAAWHILDIRYISQNHSEVFNGCEAASLLMGMHYKGLLLNTEYRKFVDEMPKSDNPHTGFYLDIYGYEPRDEAHWIDAAPLVAYGNQSAGSSAVVDLSGSSIEAIKNEVLNDNPVVIYLTYNFEDLKEIVNGVPVNLHVVLLSGYNQMTDEYQVIDPWTRRTGQYVFTVAGSRIDSLYRQVGQKAVVVRSE